MRPDLSNHHPNCRCKQCRKEALREHLERKKGLPLSHLEMSSRGGKAKAKKMTLTQRVAHSHKMLLARDAKRKAKQK